MKRRLYQLACLICLSALPFCGYAQSDLPHKDIPTTTPEVQPSAQPYSKFKNKVEIPDKNPRPVVVKPNADTRSFSFPKPHYTLLPWHYKPTLFTTLNQPYVMDYISMTRLGTWYAITNSISYPLWGTARDVQFFYPQQLLPNFYLYGGVGAMKYNFAGQLQTDFGATAGLYYEPFKKLGFNLYYQHSFRQDIMHLNPTLTPMLWQKRIGFDVEFKPNENVKFRIGIQKDTGHGTIRH